VKLLNFLPTPGCSFLDYINPEHYVTTEQYRSIWQQVIELMLMGIWARFLAGAFILLAFYFMVRRQRYQMGVVCVIMAALVIYGGTLLKLFNII